MCGEGPAYKNIKHTEVDGSNFSGSAGKLYFQAFHREKKLPPPLSGKVMYSALLCKPD